MNIEALKKLLNQSTYTVEEEAVLRDLAKYSSALEIPRSKMSEETKQALDKLKEMKDEIEFPHTLEDDFVNKTVKVGIIGTRKRDEKEDYEAVRDQFCYIWERFERSHIEIVSGGAAQGGDRFAQEIAKYYGFTIHIHYPPLYNCESYYERVKAYYYRDNLIAKESDVLIACVADERKGGTEYTIKKFKEHHPDGELILVD